MARLKPLLHKIFLHAKGWIIPHLYAMPPFQILNMSDVSVCPSAFSSLEGIAEVTTRPPSKRILSEELINYEVYFASLHLRITEEEIRRAPRLMAIVTPSTGLDHIDLEYAERSGVAVLSLKGEVEFLKEITATAELTWSLLLAVVRQLPEAIAAVRRGEWARDRFRGTQLSGKILGIVGYGRLGQIVAEYGRAFRMRILATDNNPRTAPAYVEMVSLDQLLAESDVVSVHVHLTADNRNLLNRDRLFAMKPKAVLLNTSRGAIIDEQALLEALEVGHLAGAGLDTIYGEWSESIGEHPLVGYACGHSNLVITPHIGGTAIEAQQMALSHMVDMLRTFLLARATAERKCR